MRNNHPVTPNLEIGTRLPEPLMETKTLVEIEFLPISEIGEAQLRNLIENNVPESTTLEFKKAAVGTRDADKQEFLKDITALANTAGGLLIYGIAERDSVADDLVPLTISSIDDEILRLQNILLSSIEPRLGGVEMREICLASGGHALVVRVPQSWRPPHRITHSNTNRFYLRHSKGVYEPDTEGLRQVFNGGMDQERRLEEWRDERISRLKAGGQGFRVENSGAVLVQVVSLARGQPDFRIPSVQNCNFDFMPPLANNSTHRWNFDGLLLHTPQLKDGSVSAYTQIFPSWKIEMARGGFIEQINGHATLRPGLLVHSVFTAAERAIKGMVKHGGFGPFAILATVSGLAQSKMQNEYRNEIDRSTLRFPILVAASDLNRDRLQRELLPIWDGLWQAYDFESCPHVRDHLGNWKGFPTSWL